MYTQWYNVKKKPSPWEWVDVVKGVSYIVKRLRRRRCWWQPRLLRRRRQRQWRKYGNQYSVSPFPVALFGLLFVVLYADFCHVYTIYDTLNVVLDRIAHNTEQNVELDHLLIGSRIIQRREYTTYQCINAQFGLINMAQGSWGSEAAQPPPPKLTSNTSFLADAMI